MIFKKKLILLKACVPENNMPSFRDIQLNAVIKICKDVNRKINIIMLKWTIMIAR